VTAELRAGLIAGVLAVYGFAALPLPKAVQRSTFETPVAREELGRIITLAAGFGVALEHDRFADDLTRWGNAVGAVRRTALLPVKGWLRITGTGQAWGLFTYPDTWPHQLVVEALAGDRWEVLYAGLDPAATWDREVFVYRRVRGVYDGNTTRPGASWENFALWTARRAALAAPEAPQVRVGFVRFHTTPPTGEADPQRERRHLRTFDAAHLRAGGDGTGEPAAGASP